MKKNIQKTNGNVNINNSLVPNVRITTLDDLEKFCKMTAAGYKVAKKLSYAGKKIPAELTDPDFVFIIVSNGAELGLKPMQALHNISLIDGKPVLWGDGMLAVVRDSGDLEEFKETFSMDTTEGTKMSRQELNKGIYTDDFCAICVIKRRGYDKITYKFSVGDAKIAGLWCFDSTERNRQYSPWFKYPKRMLQMRARSWALRDTFADRLKGFSTVEEARDINQTYDVIEDTTPSEIFSEEAVTEPKEKQCVLEDPSGKERHSEEKINSYINEIMAATNKTRSEVVSRANLNFEAFFTRFKEWKEREAEEVA